MLSSPQEVSEKKERSEHEAVCDGRADDTSNGRDGAVYATEEMEPRDAYHRAGSEIPQCEGTGVGEGPLGTQEQDGEEEQRRRDRATDDQDD